MQKKKNENWLNNHLERAGPGGITFFIFIGDTHQMIWQACILIMIGFPVPSG